MWYGFKFYNLINIMKIPLTLYALYIIYNHNNMNNFKINNYYYIINNKCFMEVHSNQYI